MNENNVDFKETRSPLGLRIGESIFDISYLIFDLIAGIIFFQHADQNSVFVLFGILAFTLGGGDAFHLVPRVFMHINGNTEKISFWMNLGRLITSITMTFFYLILYKIWTVLFPNIEVANWIIILLFAASILRIIICLFPQNNWFNGDNIKWSTIRNFVFLIVGIIIVALFIISGDTYGYGLWKMAIAITLSFAFYIPVVFLSKTKPAIGSLMLPKTVMYMWIIIMGLQLIGQI